MKIFAVYLKVNTSSKPQWLEEILNKYGDGYDLHITLIQPRCVEESSIPEIKEIISGAIGETGFTKTDLNVCLDRLVIEKEEDNTHTAMLMAKENHKINVLQNSLRQSFLKFRQYFNPVTQEYERNFRPHVTLASSVSEDDKREIENYSTDGINLTVTIESMVLPVVNDLSREERTNPSNLHSFELI